MDTWFKEKVIYRTHHSPETAVDFLRESGSFLWQRSEELLSVKGFHPVPPQHCLHGNEYPLPYRKCMMEAAYRSKCVSVLK